MGLQVHISTGMLFLSSSCVDFWHMKDKVETSKLAAGSLGQGRNGTCWGGGEGISREGRMDLVAATCAQILY